MSARHDRAVRLSAHATLWFSLAFGAFWWIAAVLFTFNYDADETCNLSYDQTYDPETAEVSSSFPFKNSCNSDLDMMPVFVNPTFVALGALAVLSLASLIGAAVHRNRVLPRP
jgi:hypothetical protein